ncbi:MAG: hypothetical protein GTO40_10405 [Deltaproteobacteria bacterium]|nr:hypothetical protein [Deltaproteobacteria bacterium]
MGTGSQNAVERFITKTRELFAREPDEDKRWAAMPPILKELLADSEVREASKEWPVPGTFEEGGQRRAGNLLFYEDPDYGFVINGQVHEASRQSHGEPRRAHDHGKIYTAYGLLDGHERINLYKRTDDGAKPDYAKVEKTSDYLAAPGDVHLARPQDIHLEINIGERTTAIIVRSAKDGIPTNLHGRYDLETNKYSESIGPRQIPAEMLPSRAPLGPS